MSFMSLESYVAGRWVAAAANAEGGARTLYSALNGEAIGAAGNHDTDPVAMLEYARAVGGPALRALTFHDRARLLKAVATYINEHKAELYRLSHISGATLADAKIDIDGGIGTMFVYASKGRRELPDSTVLLDGQVEMLSRGGQFIGQHIATPKHGAAVHINAFNFPVWGMLEKLAPAFLGGMPCIVKPATSTAYITEACFRLMIDSGLLPEGSIQLLLGDTGPLLDNLQSQDVVSFTGSASTAFTLRSNPTVLRESVTFIAEQDSLNATVLGPDVSQDAPEFGLFINEVVHEMTAKSGQKCTAIRRIMVSKDMVQPVVAALRDRLGQVKIGNPANTNTQMGALVSLAQKRDVLAKVEQLKQEAELVYGEDALSLNDTDDINTEKGAFISPKLLLCNTPDNAKIVHEVEAFGPVATIMPYRDIEHACQLLNKGGGSLVSSIFSHDPIVVTQLAHGVAAFHGRLYINNRDAMKESTGHGSPLPHMIHGGPGRAGGGEELGGIKGVMHYMQRTAIQGSPDMVSAVGKTWLAGATKTTPPAHPFKRTFHELQLGETLETAYRTISIEDIETFAHFTGDTFYAHMDEEAAAASPFFEGRVAHGYLLLSFAAGLFVEPDPGPVLANTGLNSLRFEKPVMAGDSIAVLLTVKRKTKRTADYGEVVWHVQIVNQDKEPVASYELLTMNAYR